MKESIFNRTIKLSNRLFLGLLALFLFAGRTSHSIHSQSGYTIENRSSHKHKRSRKAVTFNQALRLHYPKQPRVSHSLQEFTYNSKSQVAYKIALESNLDIDTASFLRYHTLHQKENPSPYTLS